MNIALIGGNSQVGTELSFLLRNQGHQVFPVVRSLFGAAFLRHHGFDCRIADVSDKEDAKVALEGVDCVVISIYISDAGGPSKNSRSISDRLLTNAVNCSPDSATIIYFSSIRAFSRRVDPSTPFWGAPYDIEKRHGEKVLINAAHKAHKPHYALRLGHVFGKNQSKTRTILEMGRKNEHALIIQANENAKSNVVHTVTIADALQLCATQPLTSGIYSVVNSPQWTWGEVFKYYSSPEQTHIGFVEIRPTRTMNQALSTNALSITTRLVMRYGRSLAGFVRPLLLPTKWDKTLQHHAIIQKVRSDLQQFQTRGTETNFIREFGYQPVPGPFVPGLTDTSTLLPSCDIPDDIFGTRRDS